MNRKLIISAKILHNSTVTELLKLDPNFVVLDLYSDSFHTQDDIKEMEDFYEDETLYEAAKTIESELKNEKY